MAAPLRIGVIGAGWIATDHVFVLRKLGHEVVAVVRHRRSSAPQKVAPEGARDVHGLGEAARRGDARRRLGLRRRRCSTARRRSRRWSAGCRSILEKPIARTLDDARAIAEAARADRSRLRDRLPVARDRGAREATRGARRRSRSPTSGASASARRRRGRGSSTARAAAATCSSAAATSSTCSAPWLVRSPPSRSPRRLSTSRRARSTSSATSRMRRRSRCASRAAPSAPCCSRGRAQGQPGAYSLDVLAPAATLRIKLDPAFTLTGQVGDERSRRR